MIEIIKQAAMKAVNANSPMQIMEAEIVSAPPELKIKLKSNNKLIIPKELITVSEHLLKHKRRIILENGNVVSNTDSVNDGGDNAIEHKHKLKDFKLQDGDITFNDELKKGDKVAVLSYNGGQKFLIVDRIVTL